LPPFAATTACASSNVQTPEAAAANDEKARTKKAQKDILEEVVECIGKNKGFGCERLGTCAKGNVVLGKSLVVQF